METNEKYYQDILSREFNIKMSPINGEDINERISLAQDNPTNAILRAQDRIIEDIREGRAKHIGLYDGDRPLEQVDLSPLQELKAKMEQLDKNLEKLSAIDRELDQAEDIIERYLNLEKRYNEKLDSLEERINTGFSKASNTINKQKGTESPISEAQYAKLQNDHPEKLKEFFGRFHKNLFQKRQPGKAEAQSANNELANKLNIRKNFLKQFRGATNATNPDQLAEEIILSLLKPVRSIGAIIEEQKQKDLQRQNQGEGLKAKQERKIAQPLPNQQKQNSTTQLAVEINGQRYGVTGYSKDLSRMNLIDPQGKDFNIPNDRTIELKALTMPKLNDIEKDILQKGKSLMITRGTDTPFVISKAKGDHEEYLITNISASQFRNTEQIGAIQTQSNKIKI